MHVNKLVSDEAFIGECKLTDQAWAACAFAYVRVFFHVLALLFYYESLKNAQIYRIPSK